MRENFILHKLHSLSGVVPVGFYMVQHLTANSFALAGANRFNNVIDFFASWPPHLLLGVEVLGIWLPLLFHAVYGIIIVSKADGNYSSKAYRYRENKYYTLQRWSGVVAFFFLIGHFASTTVRAKMMGPEAIKFNAMADLMAWPNGLYFGFILYAIGVTACAYHFAYGIWNFCIRWGITVKESSQMATARVSFVVFIALTLLGVGDLVAFLRGHSSEETTVQAPVHTVTTSLVR